MTTGTGPGEGEGPDKRQQESDALNEGATYREDDGASAEKPARPAPSKDAAAQAREAMERARASARERGSARISPQTARRRKEAKREAAGGGSPMPFGAGRDPRAMNDNVTALLRRMGWTENIEVAAVTARWREVIGDQIADHCEPVSFEKGVLLLRASSSAWATQMQLMSGQVRHRLNEEFGREVVKELRFIGPSDRHWVKGPRRVKGRGPRDTYG